MTNSIFSILADAAVSAAPHAAAGAKAASQTGSEFGFGTLIPIIAFIVIFYFLLIRPQSVKQKKHQAVVSAIKTGDRVVTSGGIHGLVSNVKEQTIIVKIADNVKIELDRSCVSTVIKPANSEVAV